jgi:DNA-binding MarR family transcriptional regulator
VKTVEFDAYVLDTLMPDLVGHDRQPAAFLVFLYLWRQTRTRRQPTSMLSLREIGEGTGLSKRSVQSALSTLVKRRLISISRPAITAVPSYEVLRPWHRRPKE